MTTISGSATVGGTSFPTSVSVTLPGPVTPPPVNPVFTTSSPSGQISLPNGFDVNNNEWSADHGTQTLTVYSSGKWNVQSNQPPGTSVKVYPEVEWPFYKSGKPYPMNQFTSMVSSYDETMPAPSVNYNAEAAWDIWLNNWGIEVMVWVDNHRNAQMNVLLSGGHKSLSAVMVNGQAWDLWSVDDSSAFWFVLNGDTVGNVKPQQPKGTVDLLQLLNLLISHGWMSATTSMTAVQFGWEICSTNNVTLPFTMNDYSFSFSTS